MKRQLNTIGLGISLLVIFLPCNHVYSQESAIREHHEALLWEQEQYERMLEMQEREMEHQMSEMVNRTKTMGDKSSVASEDSLALVALYNSTEGDNWTNNTNWLTGPVNSWYGVTVVDGYVRDLKIQYNNLTGNLPPEIGNLTNLEIFSLGNNRLTGQIPPEIGNLSNLSVLSIWRTQLTGNIPQEIGNLTNLTLLHLHRNRLTGDIPVELGNLNNLEILSLGSNQLSGSISPEIGNLSNLIELYLWGNQLTGNIPAELGNLTNLKNLQLSRNQLSGNIPPEIGNLTYLTILYLWGNQLTGNIPAELGNLNNLERLSLSSNQLSGNIPPEIGNLTYLTMLYLYDNQLTGNIPVELGNLNNLEILSSSSNQLSGTIPQEIGNLTNLTFLYLPSNQLTGDIPSVLGNLTNLDVLSLGGNGFSGSIPSELGNLTNLSELYLWGNQLTGNIPAELGNLTNLKNLQLSTNQLSGNIPPEIGNLTKLTTLNVSRNKLDSLPEFNNLGSILEAFYLTDNHFDFDDLENLGSAEEVNTYVSYHPQKPFQISVVQDSGMQLTADVGGTGNVYRWYHNDVELTGENDPILVVTDETGVYYCEVTNETYPDLVLSSEPVDLSDALTQGIYTDEYNALADLYNATDGDNWFDNTGWLDENTKVSDWLGLRVRGGHVESIIINNNNLDGELPGTLNNLNKMEKLQLSENSLHGTIPASIGQIGTLQELWLRVNQLSGEIPNELCSLDYLHILQLRDNQLTGEIPECLGNMGSLSENLLGINLSENNLQGTIPQSIIDNQSSIEYLYLHNCGLDSLPVLDASNFTFWCNDNNLTFKDLEKVTGDFNYAPQNQVQLSTTQLEFTSGTDASLTIDLSALSGNKIGSASNKYTWYKDGALIQTVSGNPIFSKENYTMADAGSYYAVITNDLFPDLSLYTDTLDVVVHQTTGIEIAESERLLLYPNPVLERLHVIIPSELNGAGTYNIQIMNSLGQVMLQHKNISSADQDAILLNVSNLQPGAYFILITDNKKLYSQPFVKH
jgi:Leucine-rich repeat (LRR) protein